MGCDIYVSTDPGAPVGSPVSVAIRPEKIMLSLILPAKIQKNFTKGIVKEIGYIGDMSMYHVLLDSGVVIEVSQPNLQRFLEREITWNDEVYLYWKADNAVVLTS
jgi:putrescine transport system ATP-binding protein